MENRPYNLSVWRVNMHDKNIRQESVPESWIRLGGRGLIARILLDEVPPECEPLGEYNKLIFSPGLLVGHMLSSCDRISIGGKSPLTGGVKESNAGGTTGMQITMLGIKALIIEGMPVDNDFSILYLDKDGGRFDKAEEFRGLGVYEATQRIREKYGEKSAIALIGPAGEMKLKAAGIQNLDKDGTPARIAARGGLGAVMGSKGLKAIVINGFSGEKAPIANPEAFKLAQKAYTKSLLEHPQTALYRDYGTAAMVEMCQAFGSLPTRNFSAGIFEKAEDISGEKMRELLHARGGASNPTHACMPGCTIRCSNIFGGEDGKMIVSPLEYETIGLMGSNLGIGDLETIARMCYKVNDLGLDSIDVGAALGVAAEAGLLQWGDGVRAMEMIDEIYSGTPLGRMIGCGASLTGMILGIERVPVVKGQAMASYEPRAIKGTGVTYATSPQGADHTCGLTIRAKVDHLDPKGQAEISRSGQINMAGYDTLGACIFAGFGFAASPESIRDLLNARYNWNIDTTILQSLGRETLTMEREFNRRAGFTKIDDRLPEWMRLEPVPPHNAVFDVPDEDLDMLFNW
ncbi:MAG: aldehyde ferredoxin oxidoreductase [Chloroflexi bacterium GWB2_49_20]|nr:MAG: aldehyde ferredoxin oxidoreductase [Chloroflexi bacterium GWB2_49_20]OGN78166.1 MAG: aldehyde ferredoxin oxidoreductase [Chloroflexi bacterium GWC2_49_37]OGN85202.1 MAG: aldehyde ferredoxin oxidoreductase [Chloroflexi bacterium GWD2_49_16]